MVQRKHSTPFRSLGLWIFTVVLALSSFGFSPAIAEKDHSQRANRIELLTFRNPSKENLTSLFSNLSVSRHALPHDQLGLLLFYENLIRAKAGEAIAIKNSFQPARQFQLARTSPDNSDLIHGWFFLIPFRESNSCFTKTFQKASFSESVTNLLTSDENI